MRHLTVIAFCCLLAAPAVGQDFETGADASKRGNHAAALNEWRPLARRGHAGAQYELGLMYEYGRGVRQNDGEAVAWYRKAATQGSAAAQYRLAILYDNSWGVPRDDAEAVKWYAKAAAQGHAYAQYDLGLMYAAGRGVARDYVRAHMWLNLARTLGHKYMAISRNEIAKRMTPAEIAEARRRAREWLIRHRN